MSEYKPLITFQPVPVRHRHDGWTIERQIAFLEKLSDCGTMSEACKHVGMSRESLRKLRQHVHGRTFRDACEAAMDCACADLEESAHERAKKGVARPVFYKGEQVGEWRHYDERLTMFLLRFRRRHRFGVGTDIPILPPSGAGGYDEQMPFDPEGELGGFLETLDFAPETPLEEPDIAGPDTDSDDE
jgi:hypothetical protein